MGNQTNQIERGGVQRNEAQPLIDKSKQSCLSDLDVPTNKIFVQEIKLLLSTSFPIILAFIMQAVMPLVSVSSLGGLGPKPLGAAALSNMFAAITGWSIAIGMSTALDTLCSQSYTGSEDKRILGLHLQRGILINLVLFIPIGIVWSKAETLMLFLGQDPELAKYCGIYLRTLIIGAPAFLSFECLKKYLQAQRIMRAQTWVMIIVVPLNLTLNFFLVRHQPTSLGFVGAPLTVAITHWTTLILGILYTIYVEGSSCWGGWSLESLTGWYVYIQLGIPGILMICSEWWAFEIMSLSASYLGTNELASQSIIMSMTNATFSVPFGLSIATCNRIGNLLGDSNARRAKYCSRAAILLALAIPSFNSAVLYFFGYQLGQFFTDEKGVLENVLILCPIAALYQLFDSVGTVSGGLLRGQGRQKLGATVNFIAFYVLAIPIGLYMTFKLNFGIVGLWLGTCLALFMTSSFLATVVLKTDWPLQVRNCYQRLSSV